MIQKDKLEIVAPAGDMQKLKTAIHFGADAVYFAGKNYGLRAFSENFDLTELKEAVDYVHSFGKKAYITVNIVARNQDFENLKEYVCYLDEIGCDAVIVSDLGIMQFVKKYAPKLPIHISTQANITNKYAAAFIAEYATRVVLARELSLEEFAEIKSYVPQLELEAFVHGAMCISYSGRCLISDYLASRPGNKGQCTQSCRWRYKLLEETRTQPLTIEQDERGSYILNSKDLNMIEHLDKMAEAGITGFKIEGRTKSVYYVGAAVNAYRRAVDILKNSDNYQLPKSIIEDLNKISHRQYSTGFYFGKPEQYYESSFPVQPYEFVAIVVDVKEDGIIVEQRNRFFIGDELEIVSAGEDNGKKFIVSEIKDLQGEEITNANVVQQKLFIKCEHKVLIGDLLRTIKKDT